MYFQFTKFSDEVDDFYRHFEVKNFFQQWSLLNLMPQQLHLILKMLHKFCGATFIIGFIIGLDQFQ